MIGQNDLAPPRCAEVGWRRDGVVYKAEDTELRGVSIYSLIGSAKLILRCICVRF